MNIIQLANQWPKLSGIEKADALYTYLEQHPGKLSLILTRLSLSQSTVSNYKRIARLHKQTKLLAIEYQWSPNKLLTALSILKDEKMLRALIKECQDSSLSTIRAKAKEKVNPESSKELQSILDKLSDQLSTPILGHIHNNAGSIELPFHSLTDLDHILHALGYKRDEK